MTKERAGNRKPTGKRKPSLKKETVKDLTPQQESAEVKGGRRGPRTYRCAT